MSTALRPTSLALRQAPRLITRTTPRRLAHDASHSHATLPKSESFGRSFYMTLALIPTAYICYNIATSNENFISRSVKAYGDLREEWTQRNTRHTKMVEQAGHDRNLFSNSAMPNHIELGYPEGVFNGGSPYNVPAGHSANLDYLIQHYRQKHVAEEEEKLAKQRAGTLPGMENYEAPTKGLSSGDRVK